ncbi:MAG: PAS domain S-box protein, partial [bacterium]
KVDPIMLADGHYHGAVHTVSDITEHRQAVEKLRENEHFLREVQEIASMGSYVLDIADGRWKSSEVLDRVLGLGPSYVRSVEGWVRLIHPDERATMAAYFREHVLGRKQLFVKEYRIIRQNDGAVRWVYGRGKLEFDPQGCPVKMKGTIHDITERKLEADALQQSEERYRLIFNASGDAMVSCALSEDGQPHTFIMVNDVACERYGYARAELLRMTPLELDAPEGRKVATAAIKKLMAEKQATWESWHQTKDGRQIPVEIVAVLFSLRGERMIFAVVRDITARKQGEAERNALQAQLAQAQKMESIGRLAGGVAHDFNNMLQVILGNADLCMMKVSPESPLHKWLRAINKSALHAKSLTRQLLAFSRREIIEPARVDLNRIVVEMMKLLPRLIGENIAIVWRPDPEPGFVKADSSPIDQILTNLAINARDAIRGTGTITIKTSHVTLHHADCRQHPGATPGDYVVLTFADTGCGMDQEIRAHIFEPFFTTKAAGKGTGLGLAMVYGIVSQNNGFIDVASAPGQGTSFNIYWPRVRGAGTHQVAGETPQAVVGGSETILLVEDEEVVRALTYEFLASLGYTVLTADGPETALRLAAGPSGEIQLLVTDVIMPVMNGRDLARRVVELRPAIKSLFVSGFAADALAQQGGVLDAGVHFLAKPFSRDDLARKVREALTA